MGCVIPALGCDLYSGGIDSIGHLGKCLVVSGDLKNGSCADNGKAENDDWGNEASVHCESGVGIFAASYILAKRY